MVSGKQVREINNITRYTLWSVFQLSTPMRDANRDELAAEVTELFARIQNDDLTIRGTYDVSGLRADADLMIWWHASTAEALQAAYNQFRRTKFGAHLTPVWSNMALHRPAEFNKSHVPDFLVSPEARKYVAVYPFVRAYDWYLLDDDKRRWLLAEHGQMARKYPDVRANTVPAFALGDYEWILAFEANDLDRIVDLMRYLRGSETRMHVRVEIPFYTGPLREITDIINELP